MLGDLLMELKCLGLRICLPLEDEMQWLDLRVELETASTGGIEVAEHLLEIVAKGPLIGHVPDLVLDGMRIRNLVLPRSSTR